MATARRVRARDGGLTAAAALVAAAALAWVVSAERMSGMDMDGMGMAMSGLGPFVLTWVPMMAAMMLPSLVPAAPRPAFAAGYLLVWACAGVAAYALRGVDASAAVVLLAAAAYQLTPLKRECLRRCRARSAGGLRHGVSCIGCSAGLMAALFALGAASLVWMLVIAALLAAERLVPRPALAVHGVALALALLGLAVLAL